MRLVLSKKHRHFYEQNGWVEFEEMLDHETLQELNKGIIDVLCKRLQVTPEKLLQLSSLRALVAGRDLWRIEGITKKIVLLKSWAEIAFQLTNQKPLRIGMDQFLPQVNGAGEKDASAYEIRPFLSKTQTLHDVASIQGIVCGLMICLSAPKTESTTRTLAPYSHTPGNGIFFNADLPFKLEDIEFQHCDYLLIVYAENRSVYVQKPEDPFNHVLKYFGYVYGDRLNDALHPILFR